MTISEKVFNKADVFKRNVHILYVPTIFCNLSCSYCYLGKLTDKKLTKQEQKQINDTLLFALNKFTDAGVLPFNVSLHGGEVTTLPKDILERLFNIISKHYIAYFDQLQALGFKKFNPHIKTNLFTFDKIYELCVNNKVSISASIDLPLSLHEKHRVTKNNQSTLPRMIDNMRLLAQYPYPKKISCTLFEEHLQDVSAIVKDIKYLNDELGMDMNQFNIMFGFHSALNEDKNSSAGLTVLTPVSEKLQVELYETLKQTFVGTQLEYGFKRNWFDEFTTSYCTSAVNCGDRFFLLQSDGSIYSCVRGQMVEPFYYGNIYTDDVETILQNGSTSIKKIHQSHQLHEDCKACTYLKYCNTGCAYIKQQNNVSKSYTCSLQKAIYRDNPSTYPIPSKVEQEKYLRNYYYKMYPEKLDEYATKTVFKMTKEIQQPENNLIQLIDADPVLTKMYAKDVFFLSINDKIYPLASQILKSTRDIFTINRGDTISIHVKKDIFSINIDEMLKNALYFQWLRDVKVVYGDEKRIKQEHVFTAQIYHNVLKQSIIFDDCFVVDLNPYFMINEAYFIDDVLNNFFFTTTALRDYHYQKQKNNAFYHIQAINLPFQNVEFYLEK